MKENRLLLCIHQIGDLGKNNLKYFTFMKYFNRFAIKSTRTFVISNFDVSVVHLPLEMFQTSKIEPNDAQPGCASF